MVGWGLRGCERLVASISPFMILIVCGWFRVFLSFVRVGWGVFVVLLAVVIMGSVSPHDGFLQSGQSVFCIKDFLLHDFQFIFKRFNPVPKFSGL